MYIIYIWFGLFVFFLCRAFIHFVVFILTKIKWYILGQTLYNSRRFLDHYLMPLPCPPSLTV